MVEPIAAATAGPAAEAGWGALAMLFGVVVASVWLGTLASRAAARGRKGFVTSFFLGNRALGAWALALTATVQSGGTFMGFPSLVYSHGWVVALWIAPYMVIPLTGLGILAKRLAQLSRRLGAVTVPDLFRARFASPALGLVSSLFLLFYMSFMMIAQFKAGALIMKISWPGTGALALAEDVPGGIDRAYYLGLALFTIVVVGYTVIGGFLAAVWTDLFQSVLMFLGVMLLLVLALSAAGGLERATQTAVAHTDARFAWGPGYARDDRMFHPLGLALSYFFVFIFSGLGSPASMVRVMATRSAATIRRSIALLSVYNLGIYLPLVVICVAARSVLPNLSAPDEVIPRLAFGTTRGLWGGSLLAGLILAAPFGAVMATVSSYLVVISSGIVRDVYQRFLRPSASDAELRRLSRLAMVVVGGVAVAANLRPVAYLQAIVVFASTSSAATFVVPALMLAFWRRATKAGVLAAMAAGSATMLGLFAAGWVGSLRGFDPMIGPATSFRPYYLLGLEPIVWGLPASLAAGLIVSLLTEPPPPEVVRPLFERAMESPPAPGSGPHA